MSEVSTEIVAQEGAVLTVLMYLKEGKINDAAACFAERFEFKDWGIDLEFKDRERLAEFFQKTREFYPDSSLQTDMTLVSGDYVISEWALRTTLAEHFYGGALQKVSGSVQGVSIVRIENGQITRWSDYYDGLASRRTALASYFTEWVDR
jgi:ketosteroid isomerase-like protein